jgi:hypothetical protein
MANFDSPNREVCTVYENRTNTPLQALDLMNDVAFLEASRKLAERMLTQGGTQPEKRLDYAFELLLARPPKLQERQILLSALQDAESTYKNNTTAASDFLSYGESPRKPDLDVRDLAAYTTIASLMLNMDATINKE